MFIALSNANPLPLYEQIEVQIVEQIMQGKVSSGFLLPSIRAFAKELGISVITVKKAYENLERRGYITTVAGKGSFIAEGSNSFIKENKLKDVQKRFKEGITICKNLEISNDEILNNFKTILEEN